MKGYKAFDENLKCREFQFKVGKTYKIDGELLLCKNGFHFCESFFNVFNYYSKNINTRICEIEALGKVLTEDDKSATSEIKIIKELSHSEILALFMSNTNSGDWNSGNRNSGDWNSGYGNSGNRNSGDWNSGDGNSGNRNSGDWNSGDWNSGNRNSGDWNSGYGNSGNRNSGYGNSGYGNSGNRNSGDWNSGDWNSGYGNSGNRNSGDWNSGDGNSGYFNTEVPLYIFNKPTTIQYTKELEINLRSLNVKPILTYVYTQDMTDKEKEENPSHKITGGFLRNSGRFNWTHLTDQDKELIKSLPNFNDEIFKVISNGVSLEEPKTVKVSVNGKEFEIDIQKAKELGLIK